ncbi:MAG: ABC transporter ATP-binding protein, partial [Treponema sp.]|nr:ABC transporter ATP-binding protein [Treponema sp.]
MSREVLLSVRDLRVDFPVGRKTFTAVRDVSFDVYRGETFSLVGESGSGKTTIGRAIMRIHPVSSGEVLFEGRRVSGRIDAASERLLRQRIQMIFQDPMACLNERAKIDYIVSEGLYNFKLFKDETERREKVERALRDVGLLPEFATRFPHEFSGGQRQRIGIARALVMEPELLIADEPISA